MITKTLTLTILLAATGLTVFSQDVNYNTLTTTSIDPANPTSIKILGQNDPVGLASSRNISFEFNSAGKARIQAFRGSSWGTYLQFLTSDDGDVGGNPILRMQIGQNGDVGIGTANPGAKLSVVHGTGYGKVATFNSKLNDEEVGIGTENNGYSWIGTTTNHNFQIYANSSPKLSVMASGNVGVGTTSPSARLHIINAEQGSSGNTLILGPVDGSNLRLGYNTENCWIQSHGGRPLYINELGNNMILNLGGGNVGIGINNPQEKLAVNGNIRAKEVKVETANWPDYVFAKEYSLPNLKETEKHIQEKGHLPGIPSAAEVKNNGVDLGEMNAKLLQKIEELTLHLIDQNKKVESLNLRLDQKDKEIKSLSTSLEKIKK
jgi:hypothetical protein